MTTNVHAPACQVQDFDDELLAEKLRTEMIQAERWELTDLGRQVLNQTRRCAQSIALYRPIDVDCLQCGATAGNGCTTNYKGRPVPFPPMHAVRHKFAAVAHRECPVADCGAGVGQPCVKVTGPESERGTPQRAVHYRREHGGDAPWAAH